jgi:predicted DNA-binding transcriptional regulator YafY
VSLPLHGPTVDASVLTAIAAACRDHERLRFVYNSDIRLTEPHRLVNSGRRWYLVAWDVNKKAWRTFRVDRLELRLPAGPRFTPRPGPSDDMTAQSLATSTWRYRTKVVIHAPATQVRDRLPAAITVTPLTSDTCEIEAGSDSPHMLALYLGMVDADFSVDVSAAPELAEHLQLLSARYQRALSLGG